MCPMISNKFSLTIPGGQFEAVHMASLLTIAFVTKIDWANFFDGICLDSSSCKLQEMNLLTTQYCNVHAENRLEGIHTV